MRSAILFVAFTSIAEAQAAGRVQIGSDVSCGSCKIVTARTALDVRGSGLTVEPASVASDSKGRFWVFSSQLPPLVFAANGAFIRQIGPRGSGPGEFLPGGIIAQLPGDTLLLFDVRNGRAVVISPNLQSVTTLPLNIAPGRVLAISSTRVVMSGFARGPNNAGMPLHFVDLSSRGLRLTRSFGLYNGDIADDPYAQMGLSWHLARSGDGGFWTAELLQYRLRKWSPDGDVIMDYERRPDWFPPQMIISPGTPHEPPPPAMRGISEQDTLVWTFIHVPDRRWAQAWPKDAPVKGEVRGSSVDFSRLFDTIVEALDIRTRRVTARTRLSDYSLNALEGGRLVTTQTDSSGYPQVTILSLSLHR